MEWLSDPQAWVALATLTALEIVLGIDNIVFISILTGKLPAAQQPRARTIGLGAAMVMHRGAVHRLRQRDLGPRPHPHGWRALPDR
jgi:predicted tellurium resistance membrane protein TerC